MLYIKLLPLLLLLVYTQDVRGISHDHEKIKSMVETLTIIVKDLQKSLKRQEAKLDEALNALKDHESTPPRPRNCAEIDGGQATGVHSIYPEGTGPISAKCDNSAGGGWTVIQKRFDGDVDFFRGWKDYAEGFGDPTGDHWLGLRHIHALTKGHPMELYVRLIDFDVGTRYAKYSSFSVSSEGDKFKLTIGRYTGNAGDSLAYHNGQSFSTKDQDNDGWNAGNCSKDHHGAWWYKKCHYSNLNGRFSKVKVSRPEYMDWRHVHNRHQSMKATVMMIRPVN